MFFSVYEKIKIMLQVIALFSPESLLLIINRCNFYFAPFRFGGREGEYKVKDDSN